MRKIVNFINTLLSYISLYIGIGTIIEPVLNPYPSHYIEIQYARVPLGIILTVIGIAITYLSIIGKNNRADLFVKRICFALTTKCIVELYMYAKYPRITSNLLLTILIFIISTTLMILITKRLKNVEKVE